MARAERSASLATIAADSPPAAQSARASAILRKLFIQGPLQKGPVQKCSQACVEALGLVDEERMSGIREYLDESILAFPLQGVCLALEAGGHRVEQGFARLITGRAPESAAGGT